ncbi:NfeD family protein [Ottowia testudinis]|uniref:NfeD family protein n=1 Tax=Ottowia testudinis TaxID=2816950 RepID=A0A975H4A6_9BURK|nr:NfeD family protein [Ottowia testudinis]QTD43712.1 NfeD family protein [Ottowia testudinis]
MAYSTWWWIATGVLVALELTTGTFYLLMLAIGGAAGALAAHLGLGLAAQVTMAIAVGTGLVLAGYVIRRRRPGDLSPRADRSVNLDVGATVQIDGWHADGTADVQYRGARWTAIHTPGTAPRPGPHRVIELVGSQLLVEPIAATL